MGTGGEGFGRADRLIRRNSGCRRRHPHPAPYCSSDVLKVVVEKRRRPPRRRYQLVEFTGYSEGEVEAPLRRITELLATAGTSNGRRGFTVAQLSHISHAVLHQEREQGVTRAHPMRPRRGLCLTRLAGTDSVNDLAMLGG